MSFPGKLSTARAPSDQEIEGVTLICPPLKGKLFAMLGTATPMNTGRYYNCFGWAMQEPTEFVDPSNHDEPFNDTWVKKQFKDNNYVETKNKDEADIEVYRDAHGKIVHFTRLYNKEKKQYSSKLGNGGPLVVHIRGEIDGSEFGHAKEYYKHSG